MDNPAKSQLPSFVIQWFLYWKTLPIFESLKEPVHPSCKYFSLHRFIHRGSKWFRPDWIFLQSWSFSLDSAKNIAMWSNHFPTSCHHATKSAPQKHKTPEKTTKPRKRQENPKPKRLPLCSTQLVMANANTETPFLPPKKAFLTKKRPPR